MNDFFLSTDSTADLFADEIERLNCGFLPLTITIEKEGKTSFLKDNFKTEQEYLDFYELLKDRNAKVYTSKNNTEIHKEYFESLIKAGHRNVLHFTISYGLANTMDNAYEAAEMLKKTYPDFNLKVVESHTTTVGQGILVRMAAKLRDEGATMEKAFSVVEDVKHRIQHFVVVSDLDHLKRGGRVSGAAAAIGTMLNLRIVISFDREGRLKVVKKVIGKIKCLKSIINDAAEFTLDKPDAYPIVVHTGNERFAEEIARKFEEKFGLKPEIRLMGPTIACHVGPCAAAFVFVSKEQRPQ